MSTAHQRWAHYEIHLAADPADPTRLLGCSMVSSAEKNQTWTIVYGSTNGGQRWTPTLLDDSSPNSVDPVCEFGSDGAAYFVSLPAASDIPGEVKRTLFFRSGDGGKTWLAPLTLHSSDREYIATDLSGGRYQGRIYMHANIRAGQNRVFTLFRSSDGGASFAPMVPQPADEGYRGNGNGTSVVLSDGTFLAVTRELATVPRDTSARPPDRLTLRRSEDGGETLARPSVITDWSPCPLAANGGMPSLAVDRTAGPFRDRLYLAWPDVRSGHCEVLFSSSPDKGKSWSPARVVNDDRAPRVPDTAPNHHMPIVAVNNRGVVGLSWYDRRENPDNHGWWVRFTASLDGGETFMPSVKVSTAPYAPSLADRTPVLTMTNGGGSQPPRRPGDPLRTQVGPAPVGHFNGGDTGGMAAGADGVFHVLWVDNRTGTEQLWTAAVTVNGTAVTNGEPDLAALHDVTGSVAFDVVGTEYDPQTRTVTLAATLTNTSKEALAGPLKVRVMSLRSPAGVPEIVGADNGETLDGAVWDFTGLLA
ncbi:MAG: exo-alpha-sialidase, partial [Acidobacteria bacterium]|nr:exo-alpha-sialidase [Acidobacteriota bacterium]